MKKVGHLGVFALIGIAVISTAGSASAAGSFSYPAGQVVYNFTTASVSIYGAVQIGATPLQMSRSIAPIISPLLARWAMSQHESRTDGNTQCRACDANGTIE